MSLLDETSSDLPVKDTECKPVIITAIQDVIRESHCQRSQKSLKMKEKDLKTRYRVSLISRNELEDKFLRLHEDNLLLKDYVRKQEDKIKRMATKLLRLKSEIGQDGDKKTQGARRDGRDLEAEEAIEDLQDRVRDLERRNEALRHRVATYKQRMQLQDGCRHCPYNTVTARIDSGVKKNELPDKYKKGLRVLGGPESAPPRGVAGCYDPRAEIDRLFQILGRQNCNVDDQPATLLKDLITGKPKDLGTEMLSLHHMQQIEDQRTTIQENVMNIRLQKELREKTTSLCALREQFQQLKESYETELQEKQKSLTLSHKAVLAQLEDLSSQLKQERDKVVAMEIDQQNMVNLQRSLLEYQEQVSDLEKEKDLLKENYENLLKSSLDSERANSWKEKEDVLRMQITRLEEQNRCHIFDLTQSKEQLQYEREQNIQLKQEVSQLQHQLIDKMQEIHSLQDKISTILSSAAAKKVPCEMKTQKAEVCNIEDFQSLRGTNSDKEDLWEEYIEKKRQKDGERNISRHPEAESSMGYTDLQKEEVERKEMVQDRQRKMQEMEAAHAETILELEKIREMLFLQHKINQDYQEELKSVKLKAECESREREEKEHEIEARLRQRNSRIQLLEAQLKDIAYGTFPARVNIDDFPSSETGVIPPTLHRGETLFEVFIGSICFTPYGISIIEDPQPVTFCIYSMYDFETHATPLVTGIRPQYNFTSCYAVTPDPEFLRFLRVGTLTVELYQVIGGEHSELARGRLKLDTVLQTTDRVHRSVILSDATGQNIGELDYWLRMHGPLSHTQCLQKQRIKAQSYLSTRRPGSAQKSYTSLLNSGLQNELTIRIWGCRSLKVNSLGHQPSPYIVYRFYHHPDHSTSIIPCSNNPQFGDEVVYLLQLTTDLERYLQREHLNVYVFDDEDTQPGGYLGKAQVPLLRLTQGHSIQGDFALLDSYGKCMGSLQMSLEWKFPYYSPGKSLWESTISGHQTPEKLQDVAVPQNQLHGKSAHRINLSKQTKSRKAEEDLQRDVSCSKRGRKDPHLTDFQNVKSKERRPDSSAEHQSEEMDTDMEDLAIAKDSQGEQLVYDDVNGLDQERRTFYSGKHYRQSITAEDGVKSNDAGELPDEDNEDDEDDDIILARPLVPFKLPSAKIRVEVASLTFDPSSEVVSDESVERVFVEFQFPGVPPEETETPLSLRKPRHGEEIYYHFSKVIHLESQEHAGRRHFLYTLLQGSDIKGERVRLKFTVVSDPMNEEDECRDVGYAYLDLHQLLRRAVDPAEETLQILNLSDPRQIIGALRVVIEAREAAQAVLREKRWQTKDASLSSLSYAQTGYTN